MCARQLGYCLAHLAYNVGNAAVKLHEMQVWQRILATCMWGIWDGCRLHAACHAGVRQPSGSNARQRTGCSFACCLLFRVRKQLSGSIVRQACC